MRIEGLSIKNIKKYITHRLAALKIDLKSIFVKTGLNKTNIALTGSTIGTTKATGGLTGALAKMFAVISTSPIGILIAAITAIAVAVYFLTRDIGKFNSSLKELEGINLQAFANQFTSLELTMYEAMNSGKTFADSLKSIQNQDLSFNIIPEDIDNQLAEREMKMNQTIFGLQGPVGMFGFLDMIPYIGDTLKERVEIPFMKWVGGFLGFEDDIAAAYDKNKQMILSAAAIFLGKTPEMIKTEMDHYRATLLLSTELVNLNNAIVNNATATDRYSKAEKKLNDLKEDGAENSNELLDAEKEFIESKEALQDADRKLLTAMKMVTQEVRKYSDALDEGIGFV